MNKIPLIQRKKIPMRKCIVTNTILPKRELIRIVINKEGQLFIDKTGKQNGRGAYIQPKLELIPLLIKNKALERALKTKIPNEFYEQLINEIKKNWD
ncbi:MULTISPECIES: RNase P modulator RnpM [Spiroplasma]|uniref:YlxR family protein n=1 Tax=Spiroplasma ixodetis TaxID=2141 RepID=A0ABM8JND4_9MOLU|nr:YlxR family protein [Spiroplasma ixodetis]MBP1527153.1 YlxR family protein [Spiroplasma ixodetis]MBP1528350.1 YlxR family protein [Spiroplasma ixodetis]